jgi:basic membrane protein A
MIKSKRVLAAALVAALGLAVAACGDDDDEPSATEAPSTEPAGTEPAGTEPPATEPPATEPAGTEPPATEPAGTEPAGEMPCEMNSNVGLLFDVTGRGDKSFNDAAAAGLDQAVGEFGINASESTPTGDADRAERLEGLVSQDNGLVIGVGFLWGDALTAGATAHPDVCFAIVDSVVDAPNVASLVFAEEQGSFLVGAAAALKSQTGTVGFIGGVENDLIKKFEAGFAAGAAAANPDIEVLVNYISQPPDFSGFNDPAKGKEIAASQYESGADVIYSAAGGSGLGAFEAAREAGAPGEVWAIGVDSDQYNLVSPDLQPYILTSMLKRVEVAVYETVSAWNAGSFAGGVQVFDLAADGVGYSTTGGFVDDIAADLDAYAEQIISGEIEVPTAP